MLLDIFSIAGFYCVGFGSGMGWLKAQRLSLCSCFAYCFIKTFTTFNFPKCYYSKQNKSNNYLFQMICGFSSTTSRITPQQCSLIADKKRSYLTQNNPKITLRPFSVVKDSPSTHINYPSLFWDVTLNAATEATHTHTLATKG